MITVTARNSKLALIIGDGEHIEAVAPKLVEAGWNLLLAGSDLTRLETLANELNATNTADVATAYRLNLASLRSIREFASEVVIKFGNWDALINAGSARVVPSRLLTEDGFEWQFGVNYLGPFALAALLTPTANPQARLVSIASLTYKRVHRMRFHDLRWDHKYRATRAHAISKLAVLMSTAELATRIADSTCTEFDSSLTAVAVYPGNTAGEDQPLSRQLAGKVLYQSPTHAAEVIAYAVCDPAVFNGGFVTPSGPGNLYGSPACYPLPAIASNPVENLRLWRVSSQLTRIQW